MSSIITREVNATPIAQRLEDGYWNLTKMAKAEGRLISTYLRLDSTKAFLEELSIDVQICTSQLLQVKKGGAFAEQGTWGHPQIAIHCAQWCSPKFAVLVSKWVFEWMTKRGQQEQAEVSAAIAPSSETTIDVVATPVVESFVLPASDRMSLLKEAIGIGNQLGGFDERQKTLLKDQLMNLLMQERLLGSAAAVLPSSEQVSQQTVCPRLELPISDRCAALGFNADSKQLLRIGRAAANLYRSKYGDNPQKREQFVHGTTRLVNVYTESDTAILDEAIKSVMEAA